MKLCQWLVAGAALLNGVLYGTGLDRLLVQMPGWRHVGATAWAAYGRQGDLGNGLILYPVAAIGGTLMSIAAAVAYRRLGNSARGAALPVYAAALLAVAGLLLTTQAAPFMLSVRTIGDDPAALQRAFDGFELWGGMRGAVQCVGFVLNVWSLLVLSRVDTRA